MEIAGYIASLFIGVSLGLIGGGGSILTVPVLVYLFGVEPLLATAYSLFIVGTTSLAGAVQNMKKNLVSYKTAFLFGSTSIISVFIIRKFILPALPNVLTISSFAVSLNMLTIILFAMLMLAASISMLKKNRSLKKGKANASYFTLVLYGIAIGVVTGFLGAGGGFLLIPALVTLLHLPMKKAVGTSLLIIALNSLIGFLGDLDQPGIQWSLLMKITALAIAGVVIGHLASNRIDGYRLKRGFGWFVLLMGTFIIVKELFF